MCVCSAAALCGEARCNRGRAVRASEIPPCFMCGIFAWSWASTWMNYSSDGEGINAGAHWLIRTSRVSLRSCWRGGSSATWARACGPTSGRTRLGWSHMVATRGQDDRRCALRGGGEPDFPRLQGWRGASRGAGAWASTPRSKAGGAFHGACSLPQPLRAARKSQAKGGKRHCLWWLRPRADTALFAKLHASLKVAWLG